MGNALIALLIFASFQLSVSTQSIERAFLQNNPKILYECLPKSESIKLTFPDPIAFSDQISNQQTYFFFKQIFSTYTTFEFYPTRPDEFQTETKYIFKARWSFQDKKNNKYVFHIFFYFIQKAAEEGGDPTWNIVEIRAEKV